MKLLDFGTGVFAPVSPMRHRGPPCLRKVLFSVLLLLLLLLLLLTRNEADKVFRFTAAIRTIQSEGTRRCSSDVLRNPVRRG